MAIELRAKVINMKTLNQDIEEPVVIGEGDADGRKLRIIFTQEAAAQFTPNTKVYLSWKHQELNIKGYNVFTEIKKPDDKRFPPTWEITYPKSMLHKGHVLANIQLVDDISISTSTNFLIHVLINPDDGSDFVDSNDYSAFQEAVITLTNLAGDVEAQMDEYETKFENMQLLLEETKTTADDAKSIAEEARQIAENALDVVEANVSRVETAENQIESNTADIIELTASLEDLADKIKYIDDKTGITEEQATELIEDKLLDYVTHEEAQTEHDTLWNALEIIEYGFNENDPEEGQEEQEEGDG